MESQFCGIFQSQQVLKVRASDSDIVCIGKFALVESESDGRFSYARFTQQYDFSRDYIFVQAIIISSGTLLSARFPDV